MRPARYGPFPYSPIVDRPKRRWSNGARLALWIVPNIEFFALDEQVPKEAGGGGPAPDVMQWAMRDYGNRVGVFRLMQVLDDHKVRGTVALNSEICDEHPRIVESCLEREWELMGHNESNSRRLNAFSEDEQAAIIKRSLDTIVRHTGRPVDGWLSAGLTESWHTLDQLCDHGVRYVADWINDDQPYPIRLDDGREIISVPYAGNINDKVAFDLHHFTADQFGDAIRAQFDVLWREGADRARVMCIALHPYLIGAPYRIDALNKVLRHILAYDEVWCATGSEIAAATHDLWGYEMTEMLP